MRRYNYFDDDDASAERLAAKKSFGEVLQMGAGKAAGFISGLAEKRVNKAAQGLFVTSEEPSMTPAEATPAAPAAENTLQPPKPPAGAQNTDLIDSITEAVLYEKQELPAVDAPLSDSAADMAVKSYGATDAHLVTEAKVTMAEPEGSDEISDAIRAFSHKSGDKVTIARIKRVAETVIENNPIEVIERVSRGKRFIITLGLLIFTMLFFVGVIFFFMHSINEKNEHIKAFNTNAGEVCADYVMRYGSANYENLYNTYGVQGFRMTGLCFARELDFDNDGNSELVLSYLNNGEYYNDVWGYNSAGDFDVLFCEKVAQSEDKSRDAWTTLYYKNGKYMIAVHDPEDVTQVTMYQLKNSKFSEGFTCTYDETSETYAVNDEQDLTSFERIKLSVLRAEKAIVSADAVMNTLDGFAGTESVVADPGTAQTLENAYYTIVQEYNKRYGTANYVEKDGKAYVAGLAVVDLVDFDGDGQNELVLVYRKQVKTREENNSGDSVTITTDKYYCDIYRYSGTRALLAYSNEGLSNSLEKSDDVYYVLKKAGDGYHYCINSSTKKNYGDELNSSSSEMEYSGTEFTSSQNISYTQSYGYSEYYVEGDSVKKSVFEEMADGIALYYETGEDYNKDTYTVTFVQRKTTDAGELSQLPDATEKAIKKLNAQYEAN